jgi:hypothetical protein
MCEGEIIGNSPTLSGENGKSMVYMVEGGNPYKASFLGGVLAQET